MRIVTVLDSYPPDLNGGAYFTHRLARALCDRGHDVLVICPSRDRKTHRDRFDGVDLLRVRSFPAGLYANFRVSWPIAIRGPIRDAIIAFAPDVIHLQGRFFLGDITARIGEELGLPLIATNHFMPENFFHYTHLPRVLEPWFRRWSWRWVRAMFVKAKIYTTPTETAARLLAQLKLPGTIHAVSCGVDLEHFRPRPRDEGLAARLGLDDRPTLLYAGRLDREKNIDVLLRALARVTEKLDAQMVLTGSGAERAALVALAGTLGLENRVHFAGVLDDSDYPAVFSLADVFVHAGTAELQSIVTLEAVSSGLPVVAADAMALPELARDGENGLLFPPGDDAAAAAQILKLLTDSCLHQRMGEASRVLAHGHDIADTAATYEALYADAIR